MIIRNFRDASLYMVWQIQQIPCVRLSFVRVSKIVSMFSIQMLYKRKGIQLSRVRSPRSIGDDVEFDVAS